ncbi:hypothetical protein SSCG_05916 [Streptomyces clavuligerus]|nr:hypothetical protein SSCG_05916 [Streptomyces clavuligerus]
MTSDRPYLARLGPSDSARPQPGRAADEDADRLENAVLTAYLAHLEAEGHHVVRHRVVTDPGLASTDLFDATTDELVMACHRTHYRALIAAYGVINDCARPSPGPAAHCCSPLHPARSCGTSWATTRSSPSGPRTAPSYVRIRDPREASRETPVLRAATGHRHGPRLACGRTPRRCRRADPADRAPASARSATATTSATPARQR